MRPVPRVRGSVSSRSSMSTTPSLSTSAGPTQSHQSTRSSRQATFYIILEDSLLLSTTYWRIHSHFLPAGRARPAQTCPPSTSLRTKLDCGTLSSQTRGVEADMARSSSLTRCLLRTTFMGRWHEGRGGHTFRSFSETFWSILTFFDTRTSPLSACSCPQHRSTLLLLQKTILPQVWQS